MGACGDQTRAVIVFCVALKGMIATESTGLVLVERVVPAPSGEVECTVDWARRHDHMQQHHGQHLLSAAFERLHGAATLSFHLGADTCTIVAGDQQQQVYATVSSVDGDDEYIEIDSIVPRLYLVTRLLTDLGKN